MDEACDSMTHVHMEEDERDPHVCPKCGQAFKLKIALKRHLMKVEGITEGFSEDEAEPSDLEGNSETPECGACGKTFKFRFSLHRHMLAYGGNCAAGLSPITDGLDDTYSESLAEYHEITAADLEIAAELTVYMNSDSENNHVEEKIFHCNKCPTAFTKKRDLIRHKRIHRKPFQCTTCGKSFTTKFALTYHIRTHTEERLYRCGECSAAFKLKAVLRLISGYIGKRSLSDTKT